MLLISPTPLFFVLPKMYIVLSKFKFCSFNLEENQKTFGRTSPIFCSQFKMYPCHTETQHWGKGLFMALIILLKQRTSNRKRMNNSWTSCAQHWASNKSWTSFERVMKKLWKCNGQVIKKSWISYGKIVHNLSWTRVSINGWGTWVPGVHKCSWVQIFVQRDKN